MRVKNTEEIKGLSGPNVGVIYGKRDINELLKSLIRLEIAENGTAEADPGPADDGRRT